MKAFKNLIESYSAHPLWPKFMSQFSIEILCSYCGEPNQIDPSIVCCGEIHAQQFLVNEETDEIIHPKDINTEFESWIKKQGENLS